MVAHAVRAQCQDREERWDNEIVGCRRDNTQQFHRHADEHETVVVVVDIPASEPGVIRGEG